MPKLIDLHGKRFGYWTVVRKDDIKHKGRCAWWICVCTCGNVKAIRSWTLIGGKSKSCGCKTVEMRVAKTTKHGWSGTPEYKAWWGMIDRCYNPKSALFSRYGAKGIKVSKEWTNSFEKFLEDMGPRPGNNYSLDRIDYTGNYCKENCRWADNETQQNNKRTVRFYEYNGLSLSISQWARKMGIKRSTLSRRINVQKLPIEEALFYEKCKSNA